MSNEKNDPKPKSYEGWTEGEKAVDVFFDLTREMNVSFTDAANAMANPVWFLNGRAYEVLEQLQQQREMLGFLQQHVREGEVPKMIADCIAKADEYISLIKSRYQEQLNDPVLRKRITMVKKRIREAWN